MLRQGSNLTDPEYEKLSKHNKKKIPEQMRIRPLDTQSIRMLSTRELARGYTLYDFKWIATYIENVSIKYAPAFWFNSAHEKAKFFKVHVTGKIKDGFYETIVEGQERWFLGRAHLDILLKAAAKGGTAVQKITRNPVKLKQGSKIKK